MTLRGHVRSVKLLLMEQVEYRFAVRGIPVPQGSVSVFNGRVVHQNDAKLRAWRNAVGLSCRGIMLPLEGSVTVSVLFGLPKPRTVVRDLPHVKPDIDKLARAVLDGLTGFAFKDDSQVVTLHCKKVYGVPRAEITVGGWR